MEWTKALARAFDRGALRARDRRRAMRAAGPAGMIVAALALLGLIAAAATPALTTPERPASQADP